MREREQPRKPLDAETQEAYARHNAELVRHDRNMRIEATKRLSRVAQAFVAESDTEEFKAQLRTWQQQLFELATRES
jgi:hypothetical protein